MKLFKVTYKKICHPSQGVFFENREGYYLSESLDKLYNYVENIQHLTLLTIEILECETVPSSKKLINQNAFKNLNDTTIIKAM